jgi:hypothetical protein
MAWLTSLPSFKSSPWMRGAPHSGLALFIGQTRSSAKRDTGDAGLPVGLTPASLTRSAASAQAFLGFRSSQNFGTTPVLSGPWLDGTLTCDRQKHTGGRDGTPAAAVKMRGEPPNLAGDCDTGLHGAGHVTSILFGLNLTLVALLKLVARRVA